MAEGINRYSPRELLMRQRASMTPSIWEACAWAASDLADEWSEKMHNAGEPALHFTLHVKDARIEVRCHTGCANGWQRLQSIAKDPECTAYGHPIIVRWGNLDGGC